MPVYKLVYFIIFLEKSMMLSFMDYLTQFEFKTFDKESIHMLTKLISGNFSLKENLTKELTFLKKVLSKTADINLY